MPRAPKQCGHRGCETRVPGGTSYCPPHDAERQARSSWGSRVSTRSSRALRAQVLRQHPTCYLHYDGCTITATEDDHVIPVAEGGTDHISNHDGACANCHRIKTKREAARGNRRAAHQPQAHHPHPR